MKRWVAEKNWPSGRTQIVRRPLLPGRLGEAGDAPVAQAASISSPQTTGLAAGKWCPYGLFPDQALDQRVEAGGQLIFDSDPLDEDFEILGASVAELAVTVDRPNALLAVTLCEVFPDGAATRVTYGVLNLTHRDSHEHPSALMPGKEYKIRIRMNDVAHRFGRDNRLRLAISTVCWPLIWPSPAPVTATINLTKSTLELPLRSPLASDSGLTPFLPPEHSEPVRQTYTKPPRNSWTTTYDAFTGETIVTRIGDEGVRRVDLIGLKVEVHREHVYRIKADDPLSARADFQWRRAYSREDWQVSSETKISVTSSATDFNVSATLDAYEGERRVHTQSWSLSVPRDLM